jgi:hypothetical protein
VSFREACINGFGDRGERWDITASKVLSRLGDELRQFGAPQSVSKPVAKHRSLFQRFLRKAEPLSLREQIGAPTDYVTAFGDSGVTLRTGNGHVIFWISLPASHATRFTDALPRIAGENPLSRTDLSPPMLSSMTNQ